MDEQVLKSIIADLCRTFGVDDNKTREVHVRSQIDLLKALRSGELKIVRAQS